MKLSTKQKAVITFIALEIALILLVIFTMITDNRAFNLTNAVDYYRNVTYILICICLLHSVRALISERI